MGSVVSFEPHRAGVRRSPQTADGSASIIIFPGVRYERTTACPAVAGDGVELSSVSHRKDLVPRH